MKRFYFRLVFSFIFLHLSCKDLIDVDDPKNFISSNSVFKDESSLNATVLNLYSRYETSIYPLTGIYLNNYVDDLFNNSASGIILDFQRGSINALNSGNANIWNRSYSSIFQCNQILEHLNNTEQTSNSLYGEALFMRSLLYFNLINIYGDVPFVESTDVNKSAKLSRLNKDDIYLKISNDLITAINILPDSHILGNNARATKWAAISLLARISLYRQDWEAAEEYASNVIKSGRFSLIEREIDQVFTSENKETIFQIATPSGYLTMNNSLIPSSSTSPPQEKLTDDLVNMFDENDLRLNYWIGNSTSLNGGTTIKVFYSSKYKSRSNNIIRQENLKIFRLAELYLIRAEANAQLNNVAESLKDLNAIRIRAGLAEINLLTTEEVISSIKLERRRELFMEEHHRFFDLKRWKIIDETIAKIKPFWTAHSALLPIPQFEIQNNINMEQNPGY